MLKLILASQSPRRRQILTEAGYKFIDLPVNVSEIPDKNLNLDSQIIQIAEEKAMACLEQNNHLKTKDFLILAADTVVILDGEMLGKPKDESEAKSFLSRLSGRSHEVKTSLFVINCRTMQHDKDIATSKVFFRNLPESEILEYVKTGEPMDKAGAYGIQALGGTFVDHVEGSMDTVVGLPLYLFNKILERNRWNI